MLKKLFNNEIKQLTVPIIGEVQLFNCLNLALQSYPNVRSHICHQKYVRHFEHCYMKELCDLFLLIIHPDCLRYTFVQHKYSRRKKYKGLSSFTIDCGQHRILVEKPKIQIVGTNYISDILSSSKYDTITAYSVFYKDDNGDYDFDFASANSIICHNGNNFNVKTPKCGKTANHLNTSLHFNNKNSLIDYDSLLNISEIIKNNKFGEVVYKGVQPEQSEKIKLLSDFVSQFDLGEEVKTLLDKFNIAINNQNNYFEEETDLQYIMQKFYVGKMLVLDLTSDVIDNNDIRKI